MEFRLAETSEYAAVAELTVAAYVGGGFVPPDADYVQELGNTAARALDSEVWVAVQEGQLVGAVTNCPPGSSHREIAQVGEGEFRMLAVAESARGRGVGEALVRLCLERSRGAGDHGMALSTMAEMTGAHRIYERLGFTRSPRDDWSPGQGVLLLAFRLAY
jgi:ribosomal protein S18 acetylase RimI-like enzyme